ncbi:MAG: LacI family DNA-binding transcriptional regulator [Solirubrobacterales bacterium]|nr:LacI family DNA-binding transcriptional regulator [Solirubrobacterales bacterium]MBV9717395.1 LacI family DNA-binding transcriptional regulator [Solirubrobacterales bacterium]
MNRFTIICITACRVNPDSLRGIVKHRTTIRELAEYTGLSPAAVSYALRGKQVSAATERRVREAAEKLGYEADPIARALAGGATAVVGLLVGSLADFWTQELVRAVQRELYGAELSALVADADGEPARELELAQRLVDQRVDGLVVVPIGPASGGWASIARQLPVVTIGDELPGVAPAGEVVFDNELGVEQALQHLSGLGHRRITVLSWAVETSPERDAERAAALSAAALGLDCRVVPCAYSLNGSQPLAAELLDDPGRPTAVLCLSDSIAYGVYAACAELGLSIPGDVAVAGFGDHPISRLLAPPLTSTVWDVEQAAECATSFLSQAIAADGPQATLREVVAPVLAVRASTGPPTPRRG